LEAALVGGHQTTKSWNWLIIQGHLLVSYSQGLIVFLDVLKNLVALRFILAELGFLGLTNQL